MRFYQAGLLCIVSCLPICCAFRGRPLVPTPRLKAAAGRTGSPAIASAGDAGTIALLDEWFRTAPYQSAFCVTAFKATLADFITQTRERLLVEELIKSAEDEKFTSEGGSNFLLIDSMVSCDELSCNEIKTAENATIIECDEISCNEITVPSKLIVCDTLSCVEVEPETQPLCLPRLGTFFLYGGLYQGCVQYYIFNQLYPVWFGEGTDIATIAMKVGFDQFVLTPFLCLPVCYLVKALVFSYPLREGVERYVADAKRDLLVKYWILWGPVQCLTFGMVPPQWRVPFIALVSFFWLLILSSITARAEAEEATQS